MGISVIIPCLDEENYIADCIASIINNGFPLNDLEILVIDGGSTDKTLQILNDLHKEHAVLHILNNIKRKTPYALNMGIEHASKAYVLIAGAHAIYPKGYLNRLYELIQYPDIDVVGGALDTQVKQLTPKTEALKFVLSHRFGVGNAEFRLQGNKIKQVDTVPYGLYKKSIFDRVGVYNVQLIRNHDIELSKRILMYGYRIWLEPTLRVTYFARETYNSMAGNSKANGFWNIRTLFITKRFKALGIRHYIPLVFILSLIIPLIFALILYPQIAYIALVSIMLYLLLLFFIVVENCRRINPFYLFWAFITLHFSYGWGSLTGFVASIRPKSI